MKVKRAIYIILLILFSLILAADAALLFLVPQGAASVSEEGSSFTPPEGVSFPGAGEGEEGSGRQRPSRSSEGEEAETAVSLELPDWVPSQLTELLPLVQKVRPYGLYILIAAILGMALCILRLVFLNKKIRQQEEQQGETVSLRRVALWPAFLLLFGALVLVVLLFPVNKEEEAESGAVTNIQVRRVPGGAGGRVLGAPRLRRRGIRVREERRRRHCRRHPG